MKKGQYNRPSTKVGEIMAFRYKINVLAALKEKGYSSTRLRNEHLLGESYMSQLRRGEMVSWAALETICTLLDCQPGDLLEHVPTEDTAGE